MKLRLKGNSVRIRLDRKDLRELIESGRVEDRMTFGPEPGQQFSYVVEIGTANPGQPGIHYCDGRMAVQISRGDADAWAGSDLVGFSSEQATDGGAVRVLLEKDFACIDRAAGEEADDAWAFPNPSMVC